MFWLDKYHVDGAAGGWRGLDALSRLLRASRANGSPTVHGGREDLDAVAFLRQLNETIYREYPDVQSIAEESTDWPMVSRPIYLGGLGFGMKWNMGWMHDTLEYFKQEPMLRKNHHDKLTFSIWYAFSENFMLPLSHDEVCDGNGSLLGRMPGDPWQQVRQPAPAVRLHVGPSRQEAALHGRRVRPAPRVVARREPGVAASCNTRSTAACWGGCGT